MPKNEPTGHNIYNKNNGENPNIYYQSSYAPKTIQKAQEVKKALQKIANGREEETVKNLREDLEEYGGTNDITFIFGNNKKGIQHIAQKHGIKTLLKVFDAVIDGKIKKFVENKKTIHIEKMALKLFCHWMNTVRKKLGF